ncbi:MAG: iron ABC transporter permease [Desulfurococcaceae archaeon]
MKRVGLTEVFLTGGLFGVLTLIGYEVLPADEGEILALFTLAMAFTCGYVLLKLGFDYYRIKYSFSLMFLSVIIALFEIIIISIFMVFNRDPYTRDVVYMYMAIATLLAPYLGVTVFGAIIDKTYSWKEFKSRMSVRLHVSVSRRFRKITFQLDKTLWFFFLCGIIYLLIFMLLPILTVLVYSFIPPLGGSWWDNYYSIFKGGVRIKPHLAEPWTKITLRGGECLIVLRGVNYGPVLNSIISATITTVAATILGTSIGYILARYRFPGHTLLRILAIVPLFNTPFINTFTIKLLWSEAGPISQVFKYFTGCYLKIDSIAGVVLSQIFAFYPIVYLNAYTAFINVDPSTEEQAENLGAKGFRIFRTVTLPLALPGIAAGATLVFVFSLEDLMGPIVFNERNFMSYVIFDRLKEAYQYGFIRPDAAAMGVILLVLALVVFLAIRNYVSMRSYAMISRGGRWNPRVRKLGPLGMAVLYLVVFPLVLITMAPQIMVILMSLGMLKPYRGEAGLVFELTSDPFYYFGRVLLDPAVNKYIINTLTYAGISIAIAVFLATCVAYSVSRLKIKVIPNVLDSLATAPLAIPGLVFALGYFIVFSEIADLLPEELGRYFSPASVAFQAWIVFIVSYSVRRLPYVVRSVFAGFQQVHENLEEAAMNLGAPRYKVVFGVIMPFIIGYILSGALLGFVYMATEVSTSITFGGINEEQAPLTYYMGTYLHRAGPEGPMVVAATGAILILIQLAVVVTIVYVFKQRYAFIGV